MKLAGRVALVTGGGSGIGEAICRAYASEGARVAVLDIDEASAKLVAESLEPTGLAVVADVADSAAIDDAVRQAESALGPLDILVNNAGIAGRSVADRVMPRAEAQLAESLGGAVTTALEATVSVTDDEWRQMLSVHLDGTFFCMRAALRSMAPRGAGVIVNIASICGIEGCTGFPHYSAAKAGILGLTRSVAKEAIQQGVRVNAIAPGYVDTPLLDIMTPMLRAATVMQTPQARLGTPTEIAKVAVFLASDDASFFVGETLSPNGGYVTT